MSTKQTPCQPCVSEDDFSSGDNYEIVRESDGRTGFQHQLLTNAQPIAQLMTNSQFKPELMWIVDKKGLNALDLASRSLSVDTVKYMIDFVQDKAKVLKSAFHAIIGETLSAFINVITPQNVNQIEDENGNSLLMYAIIHKSMDSLKLILDTFGYRNFLHVRKTDGATALHLIACLSEQDIAEYLLTVIGQEMADAIAWKAQPGNYNCIHFLCKYASLNVFFAFVHTMSDFSNFDNACAALDDSGAQPAQLALLYDDSTGPEKAYVLEPIVQMSPHVGNTNFASLVTSPRAKQWLETNTLGYNLE
ncbi:hypothetical protein [Scale drop disease virus]|uniref:ORF_084R n=1 Tax=Scale drop disease virus TaxID=1697349 RepID=A0A0K1L6J5_9VIRU|nr:ORF_084R [Scale drop disease virus]AKU37499.1 ORF_084R [Scale drop disease virus]QLI60758.1 hypothetical protein [Scale drop disease virus]QXJ13676.1 ORF084R [Scale drop disease virus]UNH60697.1 ankyrin repeat-containing protein [Scale drop disease virus]